MIQLSDEALALLARRSESALRELSLERLLAPSSLEAYHALCHKPALSEGLETLTDPVVLSDGLVCSRARASALLQSPGLISSLTGERLDRTVLVPLPVLATAIDLYQHIKRISTTLIGISIECSRYKIRLTFEGDACEDLEPHLRYLFKDRPDSELPKAPGYGALAWGRVWYCEAKKAQINFCFSPSEVSQVKVQAIIEALRLAMEYPFFPAEGVRYPISMSHAIHLCKTFFNDLAARFPGKVGLYDEAILVPETGPFLTMHTSSVGAGVGAGRAP